MICHDARELFSALTEGALTPAERGALDRHLAGCAECRRELERFRATVALLHRIEPVRAPAGFVDRVLAAAQPAPWHRRLVRAVFLPWPLKLPLEAAALVLVGVSVALVFRATPGLQQAARLEPAPAAVSDTTERAAPGPVVREPQPAMPAPKPVAPASRPATPARATGAQETKPAPPREPEPGSRPAATPESMRSVADKRHAPEARRPLGKSQERAKLEDEADRSRRQDTARAAAGEENAVAAPRTARVRPGTKEGADVAGRLAVDDREAALRAIGELLGRAGGREIARRPLPDGLALELAIPRAAWAEFAQELAQLGRFTPGPQAGELPDPVRVTLRITH